MTVRPPISPGRFHPADPALLLAQVEACYRHPLGPGGWPAAAGAATPLPGRRPIALVVPHGALGQCGPIAAHAYALLAAWTPSGRTLPGLVVLLGPDHRGRGALVSALEMSYSTPLGVVPTDEALVQRLLTAARHHDMGDRIAATPSGHESEHALENQLPFLQHLMGRLAGQDHGIPALGGAPGLLRILPLVCGVLELPMVETLATLLDEVLPREEVLLLATSDMAHCGPWYNNLPERGRSDPTAIRNWCAYQTQEAVNRLLRGDAGGLLQASACGRLSLCGAAAAATATLFARRRGDGVAHLLALSDSVAVSAAWRTVLPTATSDQVISPWDLLTDVDPLNPVGFASLALF